VIIKFMLLAVLVRLLLETDKPFLCSAIYAGLAFLLNLVFGNPLSAVLLHAAISFMLASIYFWALNRLDSSEALWWLVAVGGILIGLV
jgi:uncharacterized membrane protein YedE/YeeE